MNFSEKQMYPAVRQKREPGRCDTGRRELHMGEMYEVLSFIEHGTHCRQTMDCVQGTLLIEYLREHPRIEKHVLFEWFRKIAICVDQYHRCRNRQNYKCLNPYSIVVSESRGICLLDLEAPDNGFVMKQMQKRAMRNHFVKPVYEMGADGRYSADLFAYGKTLQFILAYAEVVPELTKLEESRLLKLTERCTGEARKRFESFQQVLSSLPDANRNGQADKQKYGRRRVILAAGAAACAVLCVSAVGRGAASERAEAVSGKSQEELESPAAEALAKGAVSARGAEGVPAEGTSAEGVPAEGASADGASAEDEADGEPAEEENAGKISGEAAARRAVDAMSEYLEESSGEAVWKAITLGETLEAGAVRCLAAAYEQNGRREDAVRAYGRLIEIEDDSAAIEGCGIKKMELEAQGGAYEQAVQTGRSVLERIGQSEQISQLIAAYEAAGAGTGQDAMGQDAMGQDAME